MKQIYQHRTLTVSVAKFYNGLVLVVNQGDDFYTHTFKIGHRNVSVTKRSKILKGQQHKEYITTTHRVGPDGDNLVRMFNHLVDYICWQIINYASVGYSKNVVPGFVFNHRTIDDEEVHMKLYRGILYNGFVN